MSLASDLVQQPLRVAPQTLRARKCAAWAKTEIQCLTGGAVRYCQGRLADSRRAGIENAKGRREIKYVQFSEGGYASPKRAARAAVEAVKKSLARRRGPFDAIVWRHVPELMAESGDFTAWRPTWAYYVRVAFVRLAPGERIVGAKAEAGVAPQSLAWLGWRA